MFQIKFMEWDVESWTHDDLSSLTINELRSLPAEAFAEIGDAMIRLKISNIAEFSYHELGTLCDVEEFDRDRELKDING